MGRIAEEISAGDAVPAKSALAADYYGAGCFFPVNNSFNDRIYMRDFFTKKVRVAKNVSSSK